MITDKQSNNVWEVGYWSTDDEEDNDSDYAGPEEEDNEDEEEEYDEEEDDDEEQKDEDKPDIQDPTEKIRQEKYEASLQPEERKYLLQVSDIEKKILEKNQFFDRRKKVCLKESDFKWWHFDDR